MASDREAVADEGHRQTHTRRNQMKMFDEKWLDINGRKHKLYVVRSMGAGRGFGVIEVLRNFVVATGSTREECYEYLRATDER
jgi:hypothetical protein